MKDKRNRQTLEIYARQQAAIASLSHEVLMGGDLASIMNKTVIAIANTLDNEYCKVLELLPDGEAMILRAGVGWKEGLVGSAIVGTGLGSQAGYTLKSNEPVIVKDLKAETRFSGPQLLHEHNVVSGMSVIIQGKRGPWGVLGTHTSKSTVFTRDDISFLQTMANTLAIAIERLLSENALKESEQRYSNFIENAHDSIIRIDEKGTVSAWNKASARIFGYSIYEIIGQPITIIIPERYQKQHQEGLQRFVNTGDARIIGRTVEVFGRTKEGVEIPIEMSLSFQKSENGQYSFTAVIKDVTERKKQSEEIKKLSRAVEQSPASVVITDLLGNIEYVNPQFTSITGYTFEEVIGKNPRVLKSDETNSEEYKELWETITSGNIWTGKFHNKKKNGELYWEHVRISPIQNEDGEITHFLAVKEDITELTIIEENLRKLSQAVEQSPSSVMITDVEGHIEYINPKFTELTGYTPEDTLGQNPRILQSGETTLEEYKELWRTIKSGSEWRGEFCNRKKNGVLYWEYTSISPVKNDAGVITHFVTVNEDVTKRKQMEEMLKRSEQNALNKMKDATEAQKKAEIANTTKSEFLANMSHEIRTPMNGIMGMTDLLLDTDLSHEQLEYADTVRNSADALLTIVNDILDFSKIEAGKMEIENIDFDMRVAVEGVIDIFSVKIEKKGLEFSCFISPEVPSLLRGDPGRLRQVMINLTGNAMKFTNSGNIRISVTMAEETNSHVTVRFDVRDTGIGIPADRMDRLFKSFSQADASTTRKYGGTGLGLSISKQIAELMGGQIGVESKEGEGSTFWFTVVLEKQPDQLQVPFGLGSIEKIRVLIVDDNSTNCRILRTYLESWHYRAEEAITAEEAMNKLREAVTENDPFKIMLLDNCIPKPDEEDLSQKIKAEPQLQDLQLVILISVGMRGDAEHFHKLGFAAYLVKPIKQTLLLDCLRIVTGGSATGRKGSSKRIVTRHSISEDHKRHIRILLAEDNTINQKIALRLLEKKLGYHVDLVTNGREAVESLEKFDYDLVLMDCQMPEMDGYEATGTIRDRNSAVRDHNIPIIAMTANAMVGDREKCLEAGMDDYVAKPVNLKELSGAIDRHLINGKKQQLSPASAQEKAVSKETEQDV